MMSKFFLLFSLGLVGLDWIVWLLQSPHVVFSVAHYGASLSMLCSTCSFRHSVCDRYDE